jgi:hypothetical protein
MDTMATAHDIALNDWVEVLEPLDAAPVGARGGVVDLLRDDVVMVEIVEPDLGDGLDRIVVAPLSKLRRIDGSPGR